MMVHYYFFICLVPFATEEGVNWRPWRFPSLRFIAASAGIVAAGLLLLPEIAAEKAFNKVFWALPSLALPVHVYNEYFRSGLAVLVFAVLWLILIKTPRPVENIQASLPSKDCAGFMRRLLSQDTLWRSSSLSFF
jgi:hypothetical protein